MEVFVGLWLFSCFTCIGISIYTWIEGTFTAFLLSLLLVPFGPIPIVIQWLQCHRTTNENLYKLADVIIKEGELTRRQLTAG